MLMRRHRWDTDQITLLPVPALAVMNVIAFAFEHQNQFFGHMAMLARASARADPLKINPGMVGRRLGMRMHHPFDLSLTRLLPRLFDVARDMVDFAAKIRL